MQPWQPAIRLTLRIFRFRLSIPGVCERGVSETGTYARLRADRTSARQADCQSAAGWQPKGEYRHGSSDAALFKTIGYGIPGTHMPRIYHEDVQTWELVAIQLFFGGAGCHMIQGRGGRTGPDLSFIGSSRNPQHLRTSLLKPGSASNSPYSARPRRGFC